MYIITGCSSGLGYSITEQLLNKGLDVVGLSRSLGKCISFNQFDNFKHFSLDLAEELDFTALDYLLDSDEVQIVINAAQFQFESSRFLSLNCILSTYFRHLFQSSLCIGGQPLG